jgi:DNA polymerase-3 subunit delta
MILKSFNLDNINLHTQVILFYGNNKGQKDEEIDKLFQKNKLLEKIKYDEKDILSELESFYGTIFNHSFFEKEKFIIINNVSDKILPIIMELNTRELGDLKIILNAGILDKKSKLRVFFEKDKSFACVPFYPDNETSLSKITYQYLKNNNFSLSGEIVNHLIKKSNGDRNHLITELDKIKMFSKNKKITNDQVMKLVNLSHEHEVAELVNNYLTQNKIKLKTILNDNIIVQEDCIIIIRTFISKIKRLIKLIEAYNKSSDLENSVNSFKPPIFWKEKEIIKKQMLTWPKDQIKKLLYEVNNLELLIKSESNISGYLLVNFLLEKKFSKTNNI